MTSRGKVLITGTDSGVGEALSEIFTLNNFQVLGTSIHPVGTDSPHLATLRFPISDGDLLEFVQHKVIPKLGHVDILINNAAINSVVAFSELSTGRIQHTMDVNVIGPVMLTKHLLNNGALRGGSVVCNVVSEASWKPMRTSLAYCTSKAALDMATQCMARELSKPHNICVFGVYPGLIHDTSMTDEVVNRVRRVRGMDRRQFMDYWEASSSVTGIPHTAKSVAKFIYDATVNPFVMELSGARLKMVP